MSLMPLRVALSNPMARRALAVGGTAALGAGGFAGMNALTGDASGLEETEEEYFGRVGGDTINPPTSINKRTTFDAIREQIKPVIQGLRANAMFEGDERVKRALFSPAIDKLVRGGQMSIGEAREAVQIVRSVDPQTGAQLEQAFASLMPARDRDINERAGTVLGGAGGLLAGLALTRGRSPRATTNALKALGVGGAASAGAMAGGLGQNASQSVLTGEDVGDQAGPAAFAGAVGAAAAGGRSGLRRLARDGAIREARMAMAMPQVDHNLPYFDRLAAEQSALQQARNATRDIPSDTQLAAPLLLHMERVMQAAGRPRMLTSQTDEGAVANLLRRSGRSKGAEKAINDLDEAYRGLLTDLELNPNLVPTLKMLEPDVSDAKILGEMEAGVIALMTARVKAERRIARLGLENVVKDLAALEGKKGGLDPIERYASRLLKDRYLKLAARNAGEGAGAMSGRQLSAQMKRQVAKTNDPLLKQAQEARGKALTDEEVKRQRGAWKQEFEKLKTQAALDKKMGEITQELNARGTTVARQQLLREMMADLQIRARVLQGRGPKLSPQAKRVQRQTRRMNRGKSKPKNPNVLLPPDRSI